MKTYSIIAIAALTALAPLQVLAENGLFISASVGRAELSEDFDGFDVDANSTAYRLGIGWRFNDYFAIDGGYHNFGRFKQSFDIGGTPTEVSLKADGFTLGATGSIPVSERVSLFARAGAYFWDGDADINSVSAAAPEDTNLYLGAGVSVSFTDRLSGTFDGSRYDLDGTTSTVLSLGVNLSF